MLEIYYFFMSIFFLLTFIHLFLGFEHRATLFLYPLLAAFLLASRSLDAGNDTHTYIASFNQMSNLQGFSITDFLREYRLHVYYFFSPLFSFFIYLISRVTSDGHVFLFAYSLLITYILIKGYQGFTTKYATVFMFFMFSLSFVFMYANTIRQAAALSIFLFSLSLYFNGKNKISYYLLILLASLFHLSVLVFIFIPFLMRFKTRFLFFFTVLTVLMNYFGFFKIIALYIPVAAIRDKFVFYLSLGNISLNFTFFSFFLMFFFFSFIFHRRKGKALNENKLLKMYLIIFFISTVFLQSEIMFNRISSYRFLVEPILFLYVLRFFKSGGGHEIVLFLFVLLYYVVFVSFNASVIHTLA